MIEVRCLRLWHLHPSPLSFESAYLRSPQPPPWHNGPWFASGAPRVSAPAREFHGANKGRHWKQPGLKAHEEGWKWLRIPRPKIRYPKSHFFPSRWEDPKINYWLRALGRIPGWRSSTFVEKGIPQKLWCWHSTRICRLWWVTIPAGEAVSEETLFIGPFWTRLASQMVGEPSRVPDLLKVNVHLRNQTWRVMSSWEGPSQEHQLVDTIYLII